MKLTQNDVVWKKKKKIDALFDWLIYNVQVPPYKMYLCVTEIATCKQLKEDIVLNIFCFITQKNI